MTLKQSDISHVIVSSSPHSVQSGGFRLQLSSKLNLTLQGEGARTGLYTRAYY